MNLTPKQTIKGTVAEAQGLKGKMKDIPSLDNTLTKEGYAADAKAVGKALETKAPISHTEDKGNPHGVTATQVGARPDTWMPSASEIGARPNTWMPTAADIGAAPAGYGLGIGSVYSLKAINSEEEAKAISETGWYGYHGPALATGCNMGIIRAEITSGIYKVLHFTDLNGNRLVKTLVYDVWTGWAWENPPMNVGVEYLTTKHYMGKPVYTMLYDCGSAPGDLNTQKKITPVSHNIHNLEMHYYSDYNGIGYGGPGMDSFWGVQATYAGGIITLLRTYEGFGVEHCYALIDYTK